MSINGGTFRQSNRSDAPKMRFHRPSSRLMVAIFILRQNSVVELNLNASLTINGGTFTSGGATVIDQNSIGGVTVIRGGVFLPGPPPPSSYRGAGSFFEEVTLKPTSTSSYFRLHRGRRPLCQARQCRHSTRVQSWPLQVCLISSGQMEILSRSSSSVMVKSISY